MQYCVDVMLMWSVVAASEFVAETFDAELNQVYDHLIDVSQPAPGTEVTTYVEFVEFVFLYISSKCNTGINCV